MTLSPQQLLTELAGVSVHKRLWVAYSGGLDSTVLLHALSKLAAAGQLKNYLCAIHVHHGLSVNADEWQLACARSAAEMGVCFESVAVNAQPRKGESPEATAREARYQAIAERMAAGDVLLTGHHQDDQAETVLIQLLRGCGIKGLAAMPATQPFAAGQLNRPLLAYSRQQLQAYAEAHRLSWVDDESNQSSDYDRNYLRNQIIPQLQLRWPSMSATLSRSASHCAEGAQLCEELAAQDLRDMVLADPMTLSVSRLLVMSRARQNNLLRYWISKQGLPLPTSRQLQQITTRLLVAKTDAMPQVTWPGAEMRRFSGQLYLLSPLPPHDAGQIIEWPVQQPTLVIEPLGLTLQRSELNVVQKYDIQIRFRQGGEAIRLPNNSHHTSLKKLFQKQGVPPWQRNRLPLLYVRGELLEIAGW